MTPSRRKLVYTGVTTSLAISFFSTPEDPKKSEEPDTMKRIQEADIFYSYYMIDNAYAILRR